MQKKNIQLQVKTFPIGHDPSGLTYELFDHSKSIITLFIHAGVISLCLYSKLYISRLRYILWKLAGGFFWESWRICHISSGDFACLLFLGLISDSQHSLLGLKSSVLDKTSNRKICISSFTVFKTVEHGTVYRKSIVVIYSITPYTTVYISPHFITSAKSRD